MYQAAKKIDKDIDPYIYNGAKTFHRYEAALVSYTWVSGDKKNETSVIDDGFKLNYCPECGKRLNKRMRKKGE